MTVKIKFVGSFRGLSGKNVLAVAFGKSVSVDVLITEVVESLPNLKNVLINPGSGEPRRNMLVLVNGKEISVLDGFETKLNDNDEIVFVPVMHGG